MSEFLWVLTCGVRQGRVLIAVLGTAFLLAACGGGNDARRTAIAGTGSVPLYESSTEKLTLPQLRVADNILTDVKLRLKADGSWALLSSGPVRAATASDAPGAILAAPGNNTDLDSTQTDATLTVTRLHVGASVFGGVEFRLTGKTWAFVKAPQLVKTLQAEDFKSNTAIRADESHHVILKSSPDTGVQNVPMQLSNRNYEFCMDAQTEGADSTTLLDATGNTVFTLKAGEACVTLKAKEGAYTLQHRYGGTGSTRTVFMRHKANTTTAAKSAARTSAPEVHTALSLGARTDFSVPKPEYWAMQFPVPENAGGQRAWLSFGQYVSDVNGQISLMKTPDYVIGTPGSEGTSPSICDGYLMAESGYDGQGPGGGWKNNVFFKITQNFGTPTALGDVLVCKNASATGYKSSYADVPNGYFPAVGLYPLGSLPANDTDLTLGIVNASGLTVDLQTQGTNLPLVYSGVSGIGYSVGQSIWEPILHWVIGYRYFPEGLPDQLSLGVGQVALYTKPGCTGPAVISEAHSIRFFSSNFIPELQGLGTSFQMGLQTAVTAYSGQEYTGEAQKFDQLTCNTGGFGSTGWTPQSLEIAVDTVTMLISTDSCEYCNLAGVDFSGLSLAHVKLSNANLNGAILSGADLSGADLRNASLQGAYLISANLDAANLCSAQLNGSQGVTQAATLTGAHLRNTNLAFANLDGVKLSSASFYSSNWQTSCQPTSCGSYVAPTCASAYNASINNTSFDSAYLSNVDMSNVTGAGVNFNNAALFGVLFGQANLSHNNKSSVSSSFINTYLQGSDLSRANLQFADFTGAQFDAGSACIQANLKSTYGNFPGAKVPASPGSSTCVLGKPAAAFCVQSSFSASPNYPNTDCTNICADGSAAGVVPTNGTCQKTATCSVASWAAPLNGGGNSTIPISSCQGAAPLCGNPFTGDITDRCW